MTKFNYFTYLLCCIVLVLFLAVAFSLPKYIPIIMEKEQNRVPMYIGVSLIVIGVMYGLIVLFDLLIRYRYSIKIKAGALFIKDAIFFKQEEIYPDFIKGYYLDTYVYNWTFETLIIETYNGQRFRIINLFSLNYDKFKKILAANRIKKLGY